MQKKKTIHNLYLCYSVIFFVFACIIYSVFFTNDKSFVYSLYGDGHICLNSFIYYGRWLRKIGMTLITEHRLCIPMWDMSVGYGSDIITTFSWMTIGDPLNLLSAFVPADSAEYLYGFLAVFRMYLTGITFSVFGLYHGNKKMPVLCGSLIYAFCGFALFAGVRDVYFMSPMIYLPLLLLGVDKIFKKEKPYIFIVVTALSCITNFYYFYMLTIWVFIYGVYRYFVIFGKKGLQVQKIFAWLIRCIGYYLTGTAIAAFMLLPIVLQLLNSERFAHQDYIPVLYSFDYYWKLLVRFITTESMEHWTHLGFTPFCLIAVFILFMKKGKKYTFYKIAFGMCVIFLVLPIFGSLMNAGSYVVNRWIWAFSMLIAYIFVIIYPELFHLSRKEKLSLIFLCCGYTLLCLMRTEFRTTQMAIMQIILLISLLALICGDYLEGPKFKRLWEYLIISCIFLGILANGILRYAWFGSNYVNSFVDSGQAWNLIHDDLPSREIEKMPDAKIVRYDSLGELEPMYNTAMNHGINGTDFYFSLANGSITRYFDELLVNVEMEHRYKGVDERTILEYLSGVKYCIAGEESYDFIPYGYNKKIVEKDNYIVYENEDALGITYTYSSYLTYEEYEELSAIQKQQAMMQCAIVKESGLDKAEPVYNDQELNYRMETEDGIQILEDRIIVTDKNANLHVIIDTLAESEIYLVWNDIIYERGDGTDQNQTTLAYMRNGSKKNQILYATEHPFYHGRDDYIVNLGYTDKEDSMEIEINFAQPGTYYYSEFTAIAQPMALIEEQTALLAETGLQNMSISDNEIRGTLDVAENKLLCIAIPYSNGWKAYIDGEKAEVKCINHVYVGIESVPGEHDVVLRYTTPGLNIGIVISIIGLLSFAGIIIYNKKLERRKKQ